MEKQTHFNNASPIHHPNLSLRASLTQSDNLVIRCLQLNNRDEGLSVNEKQFYEKVWEWTEVVYQRLKITKESIPEELPSVQVFLTISKNGSDFTVVVFNQTPEIELDDKIFALTIRQWVLTVTSQLGIKLEGPDGTNA